MKATAEQLVTRGALTKGAAGFAAGLRIAPQTAMAKPGKAEPEDTDDGDGEGDDMDDDEGDFTCEKCGGAVDKAGKCLESKACHIGLSKRAALNLGPNLAAFAKSVKIPTTKRA